MINGPKGVPLGIALISVVALSLSGCTAATSAVVATSFPVAVRGANGSVTVKTRPIAIVSLSPTATEMLYSIGAGSQVKAVDDNSDYPRSAPRTSLNGDDPNVEAIASYKPDLVVLSQDAAGLNHQLRALGVPVIDDPAASNLEQAYAQFEGLGKATGHVAQAAAEVARIKNQIAAIVNSVHRPSHRVSYYYELDQTYYSETSRTFIGQVLGLLGLRSIADTAKGAAATAGYPQLSGEFILKSNPGYIFLADTLCCGQSPTTLASRPGWSSLAAVKEDRVLGLNDDVASRWGPRVVILLREVAAEMKQHPLSGAS